MKRFRSLFAVGFLILVCCLAYDYFDRSPLANFPRAGAVLSSRQIDSKLKKAEQKLEKTPNDLRALVDKGVYCYFKGPDHIADALNAFNSAWQLGALDMRIFYFSGILYENLSLFEEAQRQYERFLRHEPSDREIQLRLARLLFRMGKWDEAIDAYQELASDNPKDVTALVNCGLAYGKRLEELKRDKKKANEQEPGDLQVYVQEGIRCLESASRLQADLPEGIYLALAKLYQENGNFEKVISACQSEIQKSTGAAESLQILGNAYEKLNQQDKALETYVRLSELSPRNNAVQSKIRSLKRQINKKNPKS